MNRTLGVIFDMDGVLIDSTPANWASFKKILSRYGVDLEDAHSVPLAGRSLRDQIKFFNDYFGLRLNYETFQPEHYNNQKEAWRRSPLLPSPGLTDLLDSLQTSQIKLGVGTSSAKERALELLLMVGVRHYFDVLVTAEDVLEHKPNPHVFLEVAKRLQVDTNNCVVIEDTANGIEAAKSAGMKAVAYLNGFNLDEGFANADLIINSFKELTVSRLNALIQN